MLEEYSERYQLPDIQSCEKESLGIFNLPSVQILTKKRWTQQEKTTLKNLYKLYGNDWARISKQIATRTPHACFCMANSLKLLKKKFKKGKQYTVQEDKIIVNLYKTYPQQWDTIAGHFADRSARAIKYRYRQLNQFRSRCLKKVNFPEIARDWTVQEDQLLLNLVNILEYNWDLIASFFQKSNRNICYWRYNHLLSVKQKILWKYEQDNKLLQLYQVLSGDWEAISKEIGNSRNPYKCLKRFHKLKRNNLMINWSQEESNKLYNEYNNCKGDWGLIQKKMEKFTVRECYFKYYDNISRNSRSYQKQVQAIKKFWRSKKQKKYQNMIKRKTKTIDQCWLKFQSQFSQGIIEQLQMLAKLYDKSN